MQNIESKRERISKIYHLFTTTGANLRQTACLIQKLRETHQMLIERYQYIFTCWSVFLLLLLLPYSPTSAQDTIRYQIGSQATLASQQYLPHYSTASRFGIFNDTDRIGGLLRAQASANHAFTDRWSLVGHIDVVSKWSSQSHQFWLQQGYLALRYRNFRTERRAPGRNYRKPAQHFKQRVAGHQRQHPSHPPPQTSSCRVH